MIKVISFDIGGTILLNGNKEDHYSLKELQKLIGLSYDMVRDAYKEVFQKQKGTLLELISNFTTLLNISINDELLTFFKNKFSKENIMSSLNPDVLEVMTKLKEQGYKMILFSNSCCLIDNSSLKDVMKYVDRIFYSYDIGYTKNEMESYQYIEKELSSEPNEILHIGDTLSSDYTIPKKNGWNSLFFGITKDKEIDSIESLKEIFSYLK